MIASRRSQPYRRGAREPGMALRNMMQGRPGFQPNPMALERETMQRQRGGLGAVLRSLPQGRGGGVGPLSTQGAARGGSVGPFGTGQRGFGRQGALQMRQARGIGQFRDRQFGGGQRGAGVGPLGASRLGDVSDISRNFGGGHPSDVSRQGFFDRERQLAADPEYLRRLELARRSAPVPRF